MVKGRGDDGELQVGFASAPHQRPLICGDSDPLLPHLAASFLGAHCVSIVVAFVLDKGVDMLRPYLEELLEKQGRLRLMTGDYFGVTEPRGLDRLLDLAQDVADGRAEFRVFETEGSERIAFHPKSYMFRNLDGSGVAFVGSSNLSRSALGPGVEWNYRVIRSAEQMGFAEIEAQFERIWSHQRSVPLTRDWIHQYRSRRPAKSAQRVADVEPEEETPEPNEFQREALAALRATRASGAMAGMVVMATGLGKTWLAAFDSLAEAHEAEMVGRAGRPQRVLFVAHREEILDQAVATFRRVRPGCSVGRFVGQDKHVSATMLFASIQSISRAASLQLFSRSAFDYVIVDEFHHAAADTYRRVIDHFRPRFLLGITATPDRTDGGDLWSLCGNNLVYRKDLVAGIRSGLLCPFQYFGVPDEVNYQEVRWNGWRRRFDEGDLERALATKRRAQHALQQWRAHGGRRGLGFCVSRHHAELMAREFSAAGVPAVAVHAGDGSAPRAKSLSDLQDGRLAMVFCVDMFNEGLDVPDIDTILMLRPTESRVLWLQQLGRGLRKVGEKVLRVIDYIGNHQVFRIKLEALCGAMLGFEGSRSELRELIDRLRASSVSLPQGCAVSYELIPVEVLDAILPRTTGTSSLVIDYEAFRMTHGRRPTARELFVSGALQRRDVVRYHGSWFAFVKQMGDLAGYGQMIALKEWGLLLQEIERAQMVKSFKMLVLDAMLEEQRFPGRIAISVLGEAVRRIADRTPWIRAEIDETLGANGGSLAAMLTSNPLRAWADTKRGGQSLHFSIDNGHFQVGATSAAMAVADAASHGPLCAMVRELIEWRLAEYQQKHYPDPSQEKVARLHPVTDEGRRMDATFSIGTAEPPGHFQLHYESSGGRRGSPAARNLEYAEGLEVLLKRLVAMDALVTGVHLATREVSGELLRMEGFAYPIRAANVGNCRDLRLAICRSQGRNPRRRIRVDFSIPSSIRCDSVRDALVGTSKLAGENGDPRPDGRAGADSSVQLG